LRAEGRLGERDREVVNQGDDLIYDLPVSFTQAALGAEVGIPTPYGDTTLEVAPGTQTGAVYRLRGKGLPRVGEGGRGDLHVRVHVWTPVKLTVEQRALLEQLAKIERDRKSTRLNSSHGSISYAVFCLKKKKTKA